MRSRPGRSVTSILPPGRNATLHGLTNPSATGTTSNATFDFCSGASVWPRERRLLIRVIGRPRIDGRAGLLRTPQPRQQRQNGEPGYEPIR